MTSFDPTTPVQRPVLDQRRSSEKLDEVTRLVRLLKADFQEKNLLPPQRNATLERLKLYTRDAEDADPLFNEEGMLVLCKHSFDGNSLTTGRVALKCLANVMLLKPATRQVFVDLGYAPKAAELLKHDNRDDEFLGSRLLFLCTYDTRLDFEDLFTNNSLADSIDNNLARQAKYFSKLGKNQPDPLITLALSESLKLFFNLTQFYPEQVPTMTKSLLHICKILTNVRLPSPPLQPPITYIINSLINLDLELKKSHIFATNPLFPKFDPRCNVNRLYSILDRSIRHYKDEELEQLASPLITLIRNIYSFAPEKAREHIRSLILPSDEDRLKPLGRSESFSSYLLRLSTAADAPSVRESIQHLLFELSDQNATNFVRNVGYGFAAGFLMSHKITVPTTALDAWSTGDCEIDSVSIAPSSHSGRTSVSGRGSEGRNSVSGRDSGSISDKSIIRGDSTPKSSTPKPRRYPINPITGQRLDMENTEDTGPPMTDSEKEREAERLFVLFERLRRTGIVDVENPVAKALQEGRFEELPD